MPAHYLSIGLLLADHQYAVFKVTLEATHEGMRSTCIFWEMTTARTHGAAASGRENVPYAVGQRIALQHIDRITVTVLRKSEQPLQCYLTPLMITVESPRQCAVHTVLLHTPCEPSSCLPAAYDWSMCSADAS